MLPPPPTLPELPEIDLNIDITLPTLPPAPKVPPISPAIKAVIKILDIIGKFYCIFKGGIGLVREKYIKARVEQMTQRKSNIMPFDWRKIKLPVSPIPAYDYKIEATVDLKFDFRELYDLAQGVADKRNTEVDQASRQAKTETRKFFKDAATELVGGEWNLQDIGLGISQWIDSNINIDLGNTSAHNDFDAYLVDAWWAQKPRILIGWPVEKVKDFLLDSMDYVLSRQDMTTLHPQAREISQELQINTEVIPNVQWILAANQRFDDYLDKYAQSITTLKQQIGGDYDTFLAGLTTERLLANNDEHTRFNSSLFNGNPVVIDQIRHQEDPLSSYLRLNKIFVDWFSTALQLHTPQDLDMHEVQYDELKTYLDKVHTSVATAQQIIKQRTASVAEASTPTQIASSLPSVDQQKTLDVAERKVTPIQLAQATSAGGGGEEKSSLQVDFTQFIDGFFTPGSDGNYHNIVYRQEKWAERYKQNTYQVSDANGDGSLDVINFDENQIYIKYGKQNDSYGGGWYGTYYEIEPFPSYAALIKAVEKKDGRYTSQGNEFRLWSPEEVSYDFIRHGQNYSSMTFARENDPRINGYVLAITEEQQTSQDKNRGSQKEGDPSRTRYLLMLPQSLSQTWLSLELEDQLARGNINSYIKAGKVLEVKYYEWEGTHVEAMLKNLPRKRYYAKVAPLHLEKTTAKGVKWLFGIDEWVLKKVGPRSRQQLAGAQAWADDQLPGVDLELIRDITWEIKARWPLLQGNINTKYTLKAKWRDNGEVVKNRIIRSGEVIKIADGDEIEIPDIEYLYPTEESFVFVGMDQAGNVGQQEVKLHILVPELEITEVRYLWVGAEIETKLSDTIDKGQIKFQKNRFGLWKPLQPDTFPIKPTDPYVVGWLYPFDDKIALTDDQGTEVATLNTQNGEIILNNWIGDTTNWWISPLTDDTPGGNVNQWQGQWAVGNGGGAEGEQSATTSVDWPTAGGAGWTTQWSPVVEWGNAWGDGQSSTQGWNDNNGPSSNWTTMDSSSAWASWDEPPSSSPWDNTSTGLPTSWWWSNCSLRVHCGANGKPKVELLQQQWSGEKILTTISYLPEKLAFSWVTLLDSTYYELRKLDGAFLGDYGRGRCVSPQGQECHIFISPQGKVLIPQPRNTLYEWTVEYTQDSIIYTFFSLQDSPVVRVQFISHTFE